MTPPWDGYEGLAEHVLRQAGGMAHPIWIAGVAILIVTLASVPAGDSRADRVRFQAALAALVMWGRFPGLALSTAPNPDESFWIVAARTLAVEPYPWHSFDPTTGGPLVPLPVLLAGGMADGLAWGAAHAAALALGAATVAILHAALHRMFGAQAARLGVLPIAAMLSLFTDEWEFLSYNSEYPAAFATACGLWFYARLRWTQHDGAPTARMVTYGTLLGLTLGVFPLLKLQAAPIGAVIGLFALFNLRRDPVIAATTALAALAPAMVVFAYGAVTGGLGEIWVSYVEQNFHYARVGLQGIQGRTPLSLTSGLGLLPVHLLTQRDVAPFAAGGAVVFLGALIAFARGPAHTRSELALPLALSAVAAWSAVQTRSFFGHYLILLVVPYGLLLGAAFAETARRMPTADSGTQTWVRAAALVLLVAAPATVRLSHGHPAFDPAAREATVTEPYTHAVAAVAAIVSPGDRIAIWGWLPPLWIATGTLPGTRDIHTERQLRVGPFQNYFLRRYLTDMSERRPVLFVDATRHTPQFEDRSRFGYRAFPMLREHVDNHYEIAFEIDGILGYRRRSGPPSPH